jgi:hypothetical protein
MNICDMADCQFYLFRDPDTKDGLAIMEIPITQCMPNSPRITSLTLTGLTEIYLYESKSWVGWQGHAHDGHSKIIKMKISWEDSIVDKHIPDSFKWMVGREDSAEIHLECIDEASAKTALVIAQLDHYRAKEIVARNDSETTLEMVYVGKVDPRG